MGQGDIRRKGFAGQISPPTGDRHVPQAFTVDPPDKGGDGENTDPPLRVDKPRLSKNGGDVRRLAGTEISASHMTGMKAPVKGIPMFRRHQHVGKVVEMTDKP